MPEAPTVLRCAGLLDRHQHLLHPSDSVLQRSALGGLFLDEECVCGADHHARCQVAVPAGEDVAAPDERLVRSRPVEEGDSAIVGSCDSTSYRYDITALMSP